MYEGTEFDQHQTALKLEIIKLIFLYVNTVFRLLCQRGIILTAINLDNATAIADEEERVILEKQKHQLENVVKNLLSYIENTKKE
jgi:hypothetical protein